MIEKCHFCGATFTVECFGDGGICGACQEPIICPHCHKTVRNERTTGTFSTTLVKAPEYQDSALSRYLGITDDEWEDMGAELYENTGSSGDMVYSYWFVVPEGTSDDILEKTGWKIGQVINDIPVDVVDFDDA
ncbi:hypothetical protein QMU90_000933 [Edwardsiella ictaluri]|uniref:Uncharacterized protein n=1 Tax=Edwardsiella ictaluri TaxID=67780 RepID=A0ABY8GDE6_EDWIC|nr:hypothetical protein [Edwardsiella ictaluri]ELV7527161.1 hypothetical protein [Edwardsiella ictaluri]KMQ79304.1 hypothetical protein ABY58_03570 [Edwardsiella ictaluri]KOO55880.1 hypothetical protein ACS33_04410 [Edwardsiella ictaluri]WFN95529.1 hypothetical protein MAY91_11260 [Edwardsiella ictaluri]